MSVNRTVSVHFGKEHRDNVQLTGATANEGVLADIDPAEGRFITDLEDERRAMVAVIGNDLKDQFFANADPIGKSIVVEGRPFEVIGVAKTKGSVFGNSRDNFLMIPAETYFKIYGGRTGIGYDLKAADQSVLQQAQDEVRVLLRCYRHLKPKDEDTFGMVSSDSLVNVWNQLTGAICGDGRRRGVGIHGGGRRGDHEHHAGGGDGANPRDRHTQVGGRAAQRYSEPVSGGIGDAFGVGRGNRDTAGIACWRWW